jgi:DNA-binding transcriptional ArsR family regulator
MSAVFQALADDTRRQIVRSLAAGPLAAGRIAGRFAISAPAVSRHLRVLRDAGLVTEVRDTVDARMRIYRLRAEQVDRVAEYAAELRRFARAQLGAFKVFAEGRKGDQA